MGGGGRRGRSGSSRKTRRSGSSRRSRSEAEGTAGTRAEEEEVMVVSKNGGTPRLQNAKCYNPSYGDPPKGTLNLAKPPNRI